MHKHVKLKTRLTAPVWSCYFPDCTKTPNQLKVWIWEKKRRMRNLLLDICTVRYHINKFTGHLSKQYITASCLLSRAVKTEFVGKILFQKHTFQFQYFKLVNVKQRFPERKQSFLKQDQADNAIRIISKFSQQAHLHNGCVEARRKSNKRLK